MKTNPIIKRENLLITSALMALLFLFSTNSLYAQKPIDFSGNWEFDKIQSTPGQTASNYDGIVIRKIIQTSSTLTYSVIYIKTGNDDWETAPVEYNLDGIETSENFSMGIIKKCAKWAEDKKSITITYIDARPKNGVSEEFLIAETLKLSDDGQTLTIETYSKNPVQGEKTTLSKYHKN
jgi:hypothetical protein